LGYLPTQSPYNANETVANQAAIPNDVVDWILIELVDPNNSATVYAAQSAFLKSNGDITNLANSSIVSFNNVIQSSVSIRLKHRNHLSVRTEAVTLSGETLEFDFRLGNDIFNDELISNLPMRNFSVNKNGLWGGNINNDNIIQYNGGGLNDRISLLQIVGTATNTTPINAYAIGDINLDGKIQYNGGGLNDRISLLQIVGALTNTTPIYKHD
jgi:hypothetical protein